MAYLNDYIYSIEPVALAVIGNGIAVLPLLTGQGTGTPGCVGSGTLSSLLGDGTADWAPFGDGVLPALAGDGTADGYRPAWGVADLPALTASGTGHVFVESVGLLPPLFGTGYCGVIAEADIPALTGYALSGYNTTATGDSVIPAMMAEAYVCGLDQPITNGATSAAVVALLQQGSTPLSDVAASICAGVTSDDARALAVLRYVASHTAYTSDSSDGIGDRWTCALATFRRGYGDCEDGAILAHSLLLAAGVSSNRLRTAFGTVLTGALTEVGHAWLMYRRQSDEEWIPLDWTLGVSNYAGDLENIRRQCDLDGTYTKISHILTDEKFYAIADVNYIARLAANRSRGEGTLAALTGDGTTCLVAAGSGRLSVMTGSGLCGARAAATLPGIAGDGTASMRLVAWGDGVIAFMSGDGKTGAIGSGTLAKLSGTGLCGFSARGSAALPILIGAGSAKVDSLARGDGTLPALTGAGASLAGLLAVGEGTIPALRSSGRVIQAPLAQGSGILPSLRGNGQASPLLVAIGAAELPPAIGRGHAVTAEAWVSILQYNPARWT